MDPIRRQLLFGLELDALTRAEALDICSRAIDERRRVLVGVVNAAKIVALRSNALLRDSLLDCDLLLADGQAVVWASRLLRRPLPERVAGIDLFEGLLADAHARSLSVYLLGARAEVLDKLTRRLGKRYPGLTIAGRHDGYFAEADAPAIAADIKGSAADMLFIGMSSPRKEIFLADHAATLGVPVLHGVGGSFDILAGVTRRAPLRWQRLGLEWLYRLLQEPRRMWRRYLTTNSAFVWLTFRERVRPTPLYWPSRTGRRGATRSGTGHAA